MNNKKRAFRILIIKDQYTDVSPLIQIIESHSQMAMPLAIDSQLARSFKISQHASAANYYRLFLEELLPRDVEKVLYLDADTIITGALDDLLDINVNDNVIAAVAEYGVTAAKKMTLGLSAHDEYFNSGMMLINMPKWIEWGVTARTIDFVINNPERIEFWDQDALNAVLKGGWLRVSEQFNFLTTYHNVSNLPPLIIHYTGRSKPWQFMDRHPYKKEYYKYLKHTMWRGYKPEDKTLGNLLRKYSLMPRWLETLLTGHNATNLKGTKSQSNI